MTTAPPKDRFGPMLESADLGAGFGVNYLGIGSPETAPASTESWAGKVRAQQATSHPSPPPMADPLSDVEAAALQEIELAHSYPDLTAEEWEALNSKEDKARGQFTLAEVNKIQDLKIKWVKSIGTPVTVESQNGVTLETWKRGDIVVYSVKNADGTHYDWPLGEKTGLQFHLNEQGEMIRSRNGDNYQVMMQKNDSTLFVDCTRSTGAPQKVLPISGRVNDNKSLVPAGIGPDGQIRIGEIRGTIKDHQFIVKLPTGAFATIDAKGKPMLAQLDKLPANITLSEHDVLTHNAFAAQVTSGTQSLEAFIQKDSPEELLNASPEAIQQSKIYYETLLKLDRSGQLANAPSDLFRTDSPPSMRNIAVKSYVAALSSESKNPSYSTRSI